MSKITRRLRWEAYQANTAFGWFRWDIAAKLHAGSSCVVETLYQRNYPPVFDKHPLMSKSQVYIDEDFLNPRTEFVRCVRGPVTLEPVSGYAISPPLNLVPSSLPGSEVARNRRKRHFFSHVPSSADVLARASRIPATRYEPRLISLRFPYEYNYYHCYADVLAKLHLMEQAGVDPTIPIAVGSHLAAQSFFQEMIQRGGASARNWIVQDGFYIDTDELFFARTQSGIPGRFEYVADLLGVPAPPPGASRRIFLTRAGKQGRYLTNFDELLPIIKEFGFEVIDSGEMSLEEQITLFGETRYLVALHGSGLTNIIHRHGAALKLVEIFPPNEAALYFYEMTRLLGFDYDCIVGSDALNSTRTTPFRLSPELLRDKLYQMAEFEAV